MTSQYFGVKTNDNPKHMHEVPFRVAMKINGRWVNFGYCKTEKCAAQVYNVYALLQFNVDAVLNRITQLDEADINACEDFFGRKESRQKARNKARYLMDCLKRGGHQFTYHDQYANSQPAKQAPDSSAQKLESAEAEIARLKAQLAGNETPATPPSGEDPRQEYMEDLASNETPEPAHSEPSQDEIPF